MQPCDSSLLRVKTRPQLRARAGRLGAGAAGTASIGQCRRAACATAAACCRCCCCRCCLLLLLASRAPEGQRAGRERARASGLPLRLVAAVLLLVRNVLEVHVVALVRRQPRLQEVGRRQRQAGQWVSPRGGSGGGCLQSQRPCLPSRNPRALSALSSQRQPALRCNASPAQRRPRRRTCSFQ